MFLSECSLCCTLCSAFCGCWQVYHVSPVSWLMHRREERGTLAVQWVKHGACNPFVVWGNWSVMCPCNVCSMGFSAHATCLSISFFLLLKGLQVAVSLSSFKNVLPCPMSNPVKISPLLTQHNRTALAQEHGVRNLHYKTGNTFKSREAFVTFQFFKSTPPLG